ncbi:MAG: TerD family protein [Acidobacteria bacterium]|nr:TerD family protein [Acidobacteriota bacterium]
MIALTQGGNFLLELSDERSPVVMIGITWHPSTVGRVPVELDVSCFLLKPDGKVRSDADFIFYNQNKDLAKSVFLLTEGDSALPRGAAVGFRAMLNKIPASITKLAFCLTIYEAGARRQSFGQVKGIRIFLTNQAGTLLGQYELSNHLTSETAVILGELYRYKDQWKFRAVGQGYTGGLAALATGFGVELDAPTHPTPVVTPPRSNQPAMVRQIPAVQIPTPPAPQPQTFPDGFCQRCGKEAGIIGKLFGYNAQTKRCKACDKEYQKELNVFRQYFIQYCADGILTQDEWASLQRIATDRRLKWDEALGYVQADSVLFLERTLTFAASDGIITDEEYTGIHQLQKKLNIPLVHAKPIFDRLDYLKRISDIRHGKLSACTTNAHLESGEVCYLETSAVYHKITTRTTEHIPGTFVATNKILRFLSPKGGWTIQWKNVMRTSHGNQCVCLELSTKKGNGHYQVGDCLYVEAVIAALTKISKRQLLVPQSEDVSRHIPQDVKTAVWQRDKGKCVQCASASYLEFDHIIPFSLGGASTLNNIQLLCRRCNLAKGNRL